MKSLIATIVILAVHSVAFGQSLSDFNIPAAAENPEAAREVKNPSEVKTSTNEHTGDAKITSAASTQDAANHAQKELIANDDEARFISTTHGPGAIAVGWGSYSSSISNPNLKLIEQRQAYLNATLEARAALAEFLNGLSLSGKQWLARTTEIADGAEETYVNLSLVSGDAIATCVSAMIRGAVIYDVQDNADEGKVMVSIVTTPKTQGAVQSLSGTKLTATSIQAGLESVFNEIKAGLVPPDGGRVVNVPSTGQIAWVGFGSAINRKNRTREVEKELKRRARDTATMRAQRSLLAIINGEDINKESEMNQQFTKETTQFDRIEGLEGETAINPKEIDAVSAYAEEVTLQCFGSSTIGKLPAGIPVKTYTSPDGWWTYAVAVYYSDASDLANELNSVMKNNSPLGSYKQKRPLKLDADGNFVPESIGSGRVTNDNDLGIINGNAPNNKVEQYYTLQKILTLIQHVKIETLGPEQKSKAIENINQIIRHANKLKNELK